MAQWGHCLAQCTLPDTLGKLGTVGLNGGQWSMAWHNGTQPDTVGHSLAKWGSAGDSRHGSPEWGVVQEDARRVLTEQGRALHRAHSQVATRPHPGVGGILHAPRLGAGSCPGLLTSYRKVTSLGPATQSRGPVALLSSHRALDTCGCSALVPAHPLEPPCLLRGQEYTLVPGHGISRERSRNSLGVDDGWTGHPQCALEGHLPGDREQRGRVMARAVRHRRAPGLVRRCQVQLLSAASLGGSER